MPDWQIALHAWQAFKLLIGLGIAGSQAIATTASEPATAPTAEACRAFSEETRAVIPACSGERAPESPGAADR